MFKTIGIIGARGMVGSELLKLWADYKDLPRPILLSTRPRHTSKLPFKGSSLTVLGFKDALDKRLRFDMLLSLAETDWSKRYLPLFFESAGMILDESAAYRMTSDVPLIIPEINGALLQQHPLRLIASPNCTTVNLAMALAPLAKLYTLRKVIVASYQSISGAGRSAHDDHLVATKKADVTKPLGMAPADARVLTGNLIPMIGTLGRDGFSEEETKVIQETRKILDLPDLAVSATCVRVPVARSHSLAVWVETLEMTDIKAIRESFRAFPGIELKEPYCTPRQAAYHHTLYVGRLRQDPLFDHGLSFWVTGDNLLKGAALNVLQIMLLLGKAAKQDIGGKRILSG
ncbi:MAG: aspartate-semialdehyde dehydrogenase [Elusimicrobiota bacterium]